MYYRTCPKCGKAVLDNVSLCPNCGSFVPGAIIPVEPKPAPKGIPPPAGAEIRRARGRTAIVLIALGIALILVGFLVGLILALVGAVLLVVGMIERGRLATTPDRVLEEADRDSRSAQEPQERNGT